jgi:hypothetical protein
MDPARSTQNRILLSNLPYNLDKEKLKEDVLNFFRINIEECQRRNLKYTVDVQFDFRDGNFHGNAVLSANSDMNWLINVITRSKGLTDYLTYTYGRTIRAGELYCSDDHTAKGASSARIRGLPSPPWISRSFDEPAMAEFPAKKPIKPMGDEVNDRHGEDFSRELEPTVLFDKCESEEY